MNLIEALRKNRPLRRPSPKLLGSNGDGWIGRDLILSQLLGGWPSRLMGDYRPSWWLTQHDLLAEDWEVRLE